MRRDARWTSGPTTQLVEQETYYGPPKVGLLAWCGPSGNGSLNPSWDPQTDPAADSLRGATAWGTGTPPTNAGPGLVTADSSDGQTATDSTDVAMTSYQCHPQHAFLKKPLYLCMLNPGAENSTGSKEAGGRPTARLLAPAPPICGNFVAMSSQLWAHPRSWTPTMMLQLQLTAQ